MLKTLRWILRVLARSTISRYKPFVIGVTGSVGKTSTKLAISTALTGSFSVRTGRGNLNNELGFPLVILGDYYKTEGWSFWIKAIFKGAWNLVFGVSYPKVLILEYAADRPGDLDYLLGIAKPDVAVVTAVGKIPVHVEFYTDPGEVAKEKSKLIRGLKEDGLAVLNFDDPVVLAMKELNSGKTVTYGFGEGADLRITSFENHSEFGRPIGIYFKLKHNDSLIPIKIEGLLGKSQAYSAAAAAAVGLHMGINLVETAERLAVYKGERGRTQIIQGIKDTYIIDDTYNASPSSSQAALSILDGLSAPRKVAILGEMAELGAYSKKAHEDLGRIAGGVVGLLITVGGSDSRLMAIGAIEAGLNKENIISFDDSKVLALKAKELISPKDIVLVKGSQSMRMERVVSELMAEPDKARQLLVRQYGRWLRS